MYVEYLHDAAMFDADWYMYQLQKLLIAKIRFQCVMHMMLFTCATRHAIYVTVYTGERTHA